MALTSEALPPKLGIEAGGSASEAYLRNLENKTVDSRIAKALRVSGRNCQDATNLKEILYNVSEPQTIKKRL